MYTQNKITAEQLAQFKAKCFKIAQSNHFIIDLDQVNNQNITVYLENEPFILNTEKPLDNKI